MMKIKLEDFIATGVGTLEKKMLGGISVESAQRAISETAHAVRNEMDRVARVTVEEINSKNLQAMKTLENEYIAKLNQKDKEMLTLSQSKDLIVQEKNGVQTSLAKLKSRISKALQFKEIETLPDGSKIFVKTNLNGAKATKIVNKEGKTTQINIELTDKIFRRTTYNPQTGKPVRRITNATKDGSTIEITYDNYGNVKKVKSLNVKKVQKGKATVVDRKEIENTDYNIVAESKMSDGTILTTKTERSSGEVYSWELRTSKDNWPFEWYYKDTRTGITRRGTQIVNSDGKYYGKVTISYPNGIKMIEPHSYIKDATTGVVTKKSRINMPKGAPVRRIEIFTLEGSMNPHKQIVTLNNGDKVELTDFQYEAINPQMTRGRIANKIRVPQKAVKILKDGTRTEMPQDDIRSWLETFHPSYNDKVETMKF